MPVMVPNQGRFGSIGFGTQTAVGTAAATASQYLRINGGSSPTASYQRVRDNYSNASVWMQPERTQGRSWQGKTINFEVELAGLVYMLTNMFGIPVGTAPALITPANGNVYDNFVTTPLTTFWNYPGEPVKVVDTTMHSLQLTMNNRANWTGVLGLHGIDCQVLAAPGTPVLPIADILQFRHHYIKVNGIIQKPESSSVNFDIPMAPLDAAVGTTPAIADLIYGFERTTASALSGSLTVAGISTTLRDNYKNGVNNNAVIGWKIGTKTLEILIPYLEVNMAEVPNTTDRIATPYSWTAVSPDGTSPFTITIA